MFYLQIWLAKWLIDIALGILLIVIVFTLSEVPRVYKELRCKHDEGVNETMACDAICLKCGKNLGFIGTWRKQNEDKSGS